MFDGFIADHSRFAAIGGDSEDLVKVLRDAWKSGISLREGVRIACGALGRAANAAAKLEQENLEIATLDRRLDGRIFRRLEAEAIRALIE